MSEPQAYLGSFRPHQGIILFNGEYNCKPIDVQIRDSFRPHQGIILFNLNYLTLISEIELNELFPSPSGDYFI